jgi:ADP-heptose:LPS heptosyltransferase
MVYNFYALTDSVFTKNIKAPMLKQPSIKYQIYLPKVLYQSPLLKKYRKLFNNNNKILVVNPNAGNLLPIRTWPIENFAQVCDTAIKKMGLNVIIVGLPRSQKDGEYICNKVTQKDRIINFIGQTANIFELLHILKTADIFLTNDSGPAHFAALTGIKNIVLFGPETPALYGPLSAESIPVYTKYLCSPCLTARNHRYTLCNENLCMKAITPKQIIEIIKQQIV